MEYKNLKQAYNQFCNTSAQTYITDTGAKIEVSASADYTKKFCKLRAEKQAATDLNNAIRQRGENEQRRIKIK